MNRNLNSIILIILAVGLYFTVTSNLLKEASLVRASNLEYETAIANAKELLKTRDKFISSYNELTIEDRAKLEKIIPKKIDNVRLIIDLNNIALRHGLSLKGIAVNAASGGSQPEFTEPSTSIVSSPVLNKISVSFGLSASYQKFISFLRDLESSLRILDLNSLSVSTNEDGIYEWKIDLSTYWLKGQ